MRRHVFFLVRYSILSGRPAGWRLARRAQDDYKRALFSQDRLSFRSWLFENLAAPSITCNVENSDIDCSTFIITSHELPASARSRLESIAGAMPGAEIVALSRGAAHPEKRVSKEIKKRLRTFPEETVFATVQLDDDDILSPMYLHMLKDYIDRPFRAHAVSFARGYAGELSRGKQAFEAFRHFYSPKIFLGLAYINSFDPRALRFHDPDVVTVYGMGRHFAIDERRPTIVTARAPAWIRTYHDENDTLFAKNGNDARAQGDEQHWYRWLSPASLEEVLAHFQGYDLPVDAASSVEGEDVTGRLRFESKDSAMQRMRAREHAATWSRPRVLRRLGSRIRRLLPNARP